jgi:alpha-ketoglutarate-dependent taurine dioxygenase
MASVWLVFRRVNNPKKDSTQQLRTNMSNQTRLKQKYQLGIYHSALFQYYGRFEMMYPISPIGDGSHLHDCLFHAETC